ncbi:Gfo/Idh/MocA family oxidoreductase [Butyricicoccus faecihominis]|uniref:Gfo/Idh/MocA family protein n=1 Tax=Butyricicoccaceae TaxID=3085642 RepID=UPI00247A52B5|nr:MULTISPECIES: Gfo/Idh/MocA family oxidoreductase [Butyricicoccaceae]MCQ5128718.1 Gfo/Idh/MocA family oxidoreductase [Butyricicoccus faecihominis]WNX85875.1 Gfo/Idh/MocA family oxidoreductase [Agathobaculum sp. NTUH-O15-33]
MKEIRIGLVGSGWMGKAHSSALKDAEMLFGPEYGVASYEIVADNNEAAAKAAQEKIGFRRMSTDWRDVVTDPNVDLVDIATPNAFHYDVAKAALENGKNVYCEKPLSLSASQSAELAKLAKEKGVINYVGYNNVMNPANAYVKDLIESGALGKIMRFVGSYDQDQLLDESLPLVWRHKKALAGAGALGDLGCHLMSISQYLMGDVKNVNALASTVFPKRPVAPGSTEMGDVENEDIMQFMAEYANGAIGQISCSRVATGRKNYLCYEIQGTKGTVRYDLERMGEVQVYFQGDNERDRGFRTVLLNPLMKGYNAFQPAGGISIAYNDMKILEVHELFSAITKGAPYVCDFEFGYKIDRTVDAVLASAEKRQWVEVK